MLIYVLAFLAAFVLSLVSVRHLKDRMLSFGISGTDINKESRPKIPEAGGLLILPAIWAVLIILTELDIINPLSYLFLFLVSSFAAVGFFDDGFRLFKEEKSWGRYLVNRALVLFLITVPFTYLLFTSQQICTCTLYWAVVFSGFLIMICSSFANSFAGLNGWEVGSSTILLGGLTVMAYFSKTYTATLIIFGLVMLGACLGLFYFNRYPARVFPGDSGTLLLGSAMGAMILFLDQWYIALGLFAPHLYDIALKLKTNASDMSQKTERPYVLKDGKLEVPKSRRLDFAKLLISKMGAMNEKKVVSKIHWTVIGNTLFWTLLYILLNII